MTQQDLKTNQEIRSLKKDELASLCIFYKDRLEELLPLAEKWKVLMGLLDNNIRKIAKEEAEPLIADLYD